jgi:predicted phosphoribosyltransferase
MTMEGRYLDRSEAGRELAGRLTAYADRADVIVLALPRGGVPVAFEVAQQIHAQLDIYTVRKLGVPGHEELAMGAVASDGKYVIDRRVVEELRVPQRSFNHTLRRELGELRRRERAYRGDLARPELRGKTIVLVDDGVATGSTMCVAVQSLRDQSPAKVIVAVPVGSADTCAMLARIADGVVCAKVPPDFRAVSLWYEHFPQTSDLEVRDLLERVARESKQRNEVLRL